MLHDEITLPCRQRSLGLPPWLRFFHLSCLLNSDVDGGRRDSCSAAGRLIIFLTKLIWRAGCSGLGDSPHPIRCFRPRPWQVSTRVHQRWPQVQVEKRDNHCFTMDAISMLAAEHGSPAYEKEGASNMETVSLRCELHIYRQGVRARTVERQVCFEWFSG